MQRPRSASRAVVAAVVALALCVVVPAASAGATRSLSLAPVSSAHPFTDPLYLPLHAAFGLDCVRTNPQCVNTRDFWAMDIAPLGQTGPNARTSHAGVYAMGAGVLHYGNAHGTRCGYPDNSFGTWVWIDHGAGWASRYGHFSRISVPNGTHVAAGQQIGVVGTTGKRLNCSIAYTDFEIFHTGVSGTTLEFPTLRACVGAAKTYQTWPTAVYPRYRSWNEVPKHTSFPATNTNCLPTTVPRTALHPSSTSIARSGSRRLTVRWARPAAADHVTRVEIELARRRSDGTWDVPRAVTYVAVSPTVTRHEFSGLFRANLYRARVSFRNRSGWSHPSWWKTRTAA